MAVAQEPFADVRADEARAAGDQKIHARKLTSSGRSVEHQALCLIKNQENVGFHPQKSPSSL
jgi:hypothetical protein